MFVARYAPSTPPRLLRVRAEHAERGVRETEARVERVVPVVGEADVAVDRALAAALEAAEVVVAGLDRMVVPDLRDAAVHRPHVGVEDEVAERALVVGRRVGGRACPTAKLGAICARVPSQRTDPLFDTTSYENVPGREHRRVREEIRNRAEAGVDAVGDVVGRQRAAAEVRRAAADRAAFLMVDNSRPTILRRTSSC
jgi:hypothetical protein